ncbi:MAG: hypothetical protein JST00_18095 [Deltaproteobacteria bacterium]|nr:hypothetical protein [Deltaproteobacteria bacterium]
MRLADPSTDDLLASIAIDMLVIQRFRGFDRNSWPMTMQPLLFRAAGVAAIVAERTEGHQRQVMKDLAAAIVGLMPPDESGHPDETAWLRLTMAHTRAVEAFTTDPHEDRTRIVR